MCRLTNSGMSIRRRSLVGCNPWGPWELDMTQWLHFHFSLSCTGEGNGNPLQCSCLENPRDGGAWWAAVYGVAQSWTRLKPLSSSPSSHKKKWTINTCINMDEPQNNYVGLPWWYSGWESTCQFRGHWFNSWSREIPRALEQLSLCTTTTDPML